MSAKKPAPDDLDLVLDFVNTADLETGAEALGSPAELSDWLADRGLLAPAAKLGTADLASAIELREALRRAMLAHNGGPAENADEALLERTARRGNLSVSFNDGDARLVPLDTGLAGALAALLVPVARSMADGSWARAKACRADDCHWGFYDFSRNHSGTWCDMAVCGNREKVRAYRDRGARESP
jgi:predicted RNA-binding Zn ribbon-like protein